MKTLKMLPILGCVLFLTTASTCHKDDDDSSISDDRRENNIVEQTVQQGSWRITYYYDTDSDETGRFSNYTFSFNSGNVLVATNGDNTYNGSWSITDSSSGDDNPHGDLDFNIAFSSPASFSELTDDWDIVTYTSTKIELIDVSGGNGGTDHLVFEKN